MAAQATVALEKAKKLEPDKASIREALGIAYFRIQRWQRPKRSFAPFSTSRRPTTTRTTRSGGRSRSRAATRRRTVTTSSRARWSPAASSTPTGSDRASDRTSRARRERVVQRVSGARVRVDGDAAARSAPACCVLLGVAASDAEAAADRLAGKIARLRIFQDDDGNFDRSLLDTGGAALVVSPVHAAGGQQTPEGNSPGFLERRAAGGRRAALRLLLRVAKQSSDCGARPASSARGWKSSS